MKKILLLLALVLPLAVSAQKFGHVNTQEVFALMPELNQVKAQMDTLQNTYESQIANMQEEYQKKIADFQKNYQTLPEGAREIRQQEIAEMEQRIQLFYQTAQQEIQKRQQELLAPLQKKLVNAIQEVGKENSFTYIFDTAMGAVAYQAADATDVAPLVKAKLGIK